MIFNSLNSNLVRMRHSQSNERLEISRFDLGCEITVT